MSTKFQDAFATLGDIELARELEEDEREREKADRRSKSRSRRGMIFKGEGGSLPSHIITMQEARTYLQDLGRRGEVEETVGMTLGILQNLFDSGLNLEEIKDETIKVFYDSANEIAKKAAIAKSRGGREVVKAGYYSISGVTDISGAIRRLQMSAGTEEIIIDLDTLESAVESEIKKNLPAGNRELALSQLKLDMSKFSARKAGVRWTVTINPRPRNIGIGF